MSLQKQKILAEYMEKFGKKLNMGEGRLGDELFMWLQDRVAAELTEAGQRGYLRGYKEVNKAAGNVQDDTLKKHGVLCPQCNDYLESLHCFGCDVTYKLSPPTK